MIYIYYIIIILLYYIIILLTFYQSVNLKNIIVRLKRAV